MKHNHKYYVYYVFFDKDKKVYVERIECIYSVKEFKKRIQHRLITRMYIQKVW